MARTALHACAASSIEDLFPLGSEVGAAAVSSAAPPRHALQTLDLGVDALVPVLSTVFKFQSYPLIAMFN